MIKFKNDQLPSWGELKALGVRKEITSPEQFHKEVEKSYATALQDLKKSAEIGLPNSEILKDVHKTIFGSVLEKVGDFRADVATSERRGIVAALDSIAEKWNVPIDKPTSMTHVNGIAEFAATVMKESPFPDTERKFICRTVAMCTVESQLQDKFPDAELKLEVDAKKFDNAIDRANRPEPLVHEMRALVRDMTAGKANVIDMEQFRQEKKQLEHSPTPDRGPEHDR